MATYPASGVAPYLLSFPITTRESVDCTRSLIVDFALLATKKGSALIATDVIQCVPVFSGEFVENVFLRTVVASSNAGVIGIGDTASSTLYHPNTIGTNTTAGTVVGVVTPSAARFTTTNVTNLGKIYTADDTIDLLIGATVPTDGQMEIIVQIKQIFAS
jgi:hypothetical protein